MQRHHCPVCRCLFPVAGPQLESRIIDGHVWVGMAENAQRLAEENVELRREIQRLRKRNG